MKLNHLFIVAFVATAGIMLSSGAFAAAGEYVCKTSATANVAATLNSLACDVSKPVSVSEKGGTDWTSGYANVVSTKTVDSYLVCCVQK